MKLQNIVPVVLEYDPETMSNVTQSKPHEQSELTYAVCWFDGFMTGSQATAIKLKWAGLGAGAPDSSLVKDHCSTTDHGNDIRPVTCVYVSTLV